MSHSSWSHSGLCWCPETLQWCFAVQWMSVEFFCLMQFREKDAQQVLCTARWPNLSKTLQLPFLCLKHLVSVPELTLMGDIWREREGNSPNTLRTNKAFKGIYFHTGRATHKEANVLTCLSAAQHLCLSVSEGVGKCWLWMSVNTRTQILTRLPLTLLLFAMCQRGEDWWRSTFAFPTTVSLRTFSSFKTKNALMIMKERENSLFEKRKPIFDNALVWQEGRGWEKIWRETQKRGCWVQMTATAGVCVCVCVCLCACPPKSLQQHWPSSMAVLQYSVYCSLA